MNNQTKNKIKADLQLISKFLLRDLKASDKVLRAMVRILIGTATAQLLQSNSFDNAREIYDEDYESSVMEEVIIKNYYFTNKKGTYIGT